MDIPREFQDEYCDFFFSPKERAPDNVRNFLARHGITTRNKIKVEEYCIKPRSALFIVGTLEANSSPAGLAGPPSLPAGTHSDGFDAHTVLSKGTHNKTFLISTHSRQELVGTLGWQSATMIWCGPIIALVSLYLLLDSMGLL